MTGPSPRFLWLLSLLAVASCATYAAAVLAGASLTNILALDSIAAEHEQWHIRAVAATELEGLKVVYSTPLFFKQLSSSCLWLKAASGTYLKG